MSAKANLKIDWCTHEAAKYAVENWHYSKRMPMPPLVKIGVWEDGKFIGCVLFARGANMNIGAPYHLACTEVAELVRVALTKHATPVSRIMRIACKFLTERSPGLRLLVSYADPSEGHHGGIYQACGWVYEGSCGEATQFFHEGRWKHQREVTAGAFRNPNTKRNWKSLPRRKMPGKHKYLLPLDDAMRAQVAPLAKPYPKRKLDGARGDGVECERAGKGSPDGSTLGEGSSILTPALHRGASSHTKFRKRL